MRPDAGHGEASAPVTLGELGIARAWNLRGDAANAAFVSQVQRVLGLPLPVAPMTSACGEHDALLWLGPRAWLYIAGVSATHHDFDAARRSVNAVRGALFDVSASHVAWTVSGAIAGRVLNRSCPLDFHPDAFAAGHCAQSLLGHVSALFYRPCASPTFVVMVARSFAADAWRTLCDTAASDGYRVASPAPFAMV
jgi:sarcosine oxidase subunit gamma